MPMPIKGPSHSPAMFTIVRNRVDSKSPDSPLWEIRDQPSRQFSAFICLGCSKSAMTSKVPFMACSRCKAVKYCSKECQVKDWKGMGNGPTSPRKHKDVCNDLRCDIIEFDSHPTASPVLLRKNVFAAWADQHHPIEKTFHLNEFLARKQLLGGAGVGYWALPDVLTPYHESGSDSSGFQNGQMLLEAEFPSTETGWTEGLSLSEQVDVRTKPSNLLSLDLGKGLSGWEDYLKFRGLTPLSIAPLLMTNVLTIYHMIHHCLQLPALKKALKLYVLAVESELNQIPLLEELTHLLPGLDLELVFLSPAAKSVCAVATQHEQKCLLLNENNIVLDFANGSGRLRVRVDPEYEYYDDVPYDIVPDAILGLNVGLASYPAWAPTMQKILRMGTPFCFSDQTKMIHRFTISSWLPSVIRTINNAFPDYPVLEMPETSIEVNPFHGIVGRDLAYMLAPNVSNGYVIIGFPIV